MKKTGFIFLLIFFCKTYLVAQTTSDSLLNLMNSNHPYNEYIAELTQLFTGYAILKDFDKLIEVGTVALKKAEENKDTLAIAIITRAIGIGNYFKGNYNIAAKHYLKAISLLSQFNDVNQLAITYNEMGKLYRKTKDYPRSLRYYDLAYKIYIDTEDIIGQGTILNESGVVYEYMQNYDEALNRYQASLKFAEELKEEIGISYSKSFIAGVYLIQKKYSEAEKLFLDVIAIRERMNDQFGLTFAYGNLGKLYSEKGDYAKAEQGLLKSLAIAERMNYTEQKANLYFDLVKVYERKGDFKGAYTYYQQNRSIVDSLFSVQKAKQIEELNAIYETAQKEQLIKEQEFAINRQRYLLFGSIGLFVFVGFIAFTQYKRYRYKQAIALQTEINKQQNLATKAVLIAEEKERERIAKDLHDGVGQLMSAAKINLSVLESELEINSEDQKLAMELTMQLIDESCAEVRAVSHNLMPNALLKNGLVTAIKSFINKVDKRALKIDLQLKGLEKRLEPNTESVLYRVIQECINNVIKHAVATEMTIHLEWTNTLFIAFISDNGKGFEMKNVKANEGIGLNNIRSRVEFLKGQLHYTTSLGNGTKVNIRVPVG